MKSAIPPLVGSIGGIVTIWPVVCFPSVLAAIFYQVRKAMLSSQASGQISKPSLNRRHEYG